MKPYFVGPRAESPPFLHDGYAKPYFLAWWPRFFFCVSSPPSRDCCLSDCNEEEEKEETARGRERERVIIRPQISAMLHLVGTQKKIATAASDLRVVPTSSLDPSD